METKKLIICRGIQGSGKSTWAKQWCHEDPEHRVRYNNDDVRNMLGDYWVPKREPTVSAIKEIILSEFMCRFLDIVVDNMNLSPKEIGYLTKKVENFNSANNIKYEIEYKDFFIPVEECIRRDAMRPNPIGAKVIKDTWRRYRNSIIAELAKKAVAKRPEVVMGRKGALLVDMDGTLSLNTTGRPFYGEGAAEGMLNDADNTDVCLMVQAFCEHTDSELIIVTGREDTEEIRTATLEWLDKNWVYPSRLLMRPSGDFSSAEVCKRKIYEEHIKDNYNVLGVFDDSQKCVDMWRELGLTCFQPNDGSF